MIDIKCLVCSQTLIIPAWINTEEFKGEIKCEKCLSRVGVIFVSSELREYKVTKDSKVIDRNGHTFNGEGLPEILGKLRGYKMSLSEEDEKRLYDLDDQISTVHKRIKDLISSEEDSHILPHLTPEQHKEFIELIDQDKQLWAELFSIVRGY